MKKLVMFFAWELPMFFMKIGLIVGAVLVLIQMVTAA